MVQRRRSLERAYDTRREPSGQSRGLHGRRLLRRHGRGNGHQPGARREGQARSRSRILDRRGAWTSIRGIHACHHHGNECEPDGLQGVRQSSHLPGIFASLLTIPLARGGPAGDRHPVELALSHAVRKRGSPGGRVVFAVAYLSLQTLLIVTAARRPEHAFGFRMFSESCTVRLSLLREVGAPSGHGTLVVPALRGEWTAVDADGDRHRFEWKSRVRAPLLSSFDFFFEASYGAAAELSRIQAALDDVATHIDGDAETHRLLADVTVKRNGREPSVVRLASAERTLTQPP